jgi:membrane protein required for colicin V production
MSLEFSPVDLVAVLVIVGSMSYAIWRGFIAETLGIVAWAAAAFASLYFGAWVARLAHTLITSAWLAIIAGYLLVFVAVFIPIQFASHRFSEGVRNSAVGPLDRALGAAFGIVRGLAILGFCYLVFDAFVPTASQPRWLTEARTLPMIRSSAQVLLTLVPERDHHAAAVVPPTPKPASAQPPQHAAPAQNQANAVKKKHTKKSRSAQDRQALDRLFQASGSSGGGNR